MGKSEVKEMFSFITGTAALVILGLLIAFTSVTSLNKVHEYVFGVASRSREHRQIEANVRREMHATRNNQHRSE
jgi:hypothetical protein